MKKWLLGLTGTIVVISIAWTLVHYWPTFKFMREIPKANSNIQPDWKTYKSTDSGISIDCPFPLRWENKDQTTKNGKALQISWAMSEANLSGFLASASRFRFPNKDDSFNSDILLEKTVLWPLQNSGFAKVKWKNEPMTVSGMPATLTTGSYSLSNVPYSFFVLIAVDPNQHQYWKVNAQQPGPGDFEKISSRMIQSLKIVP